jgi:hypothetical protein
MFAALCRTREIRSRAPPMRVAPVRVAPMRRSDQLPHKRRLLHGRAASPGLCISLFLLLAGFERILIEKIRVNVRYDVFGIYITQAEAISLLLIIAGLAGFLTTLLTAEYLEPHTRAIPKNTRSRPTVMTDPFSRQHATVIGAAWTLRSRNESNA